jgi:hypothetical protein
VFCPLPSDNPTSFANTCSPPPQIPGRSSARCVHPSGAPSTWSSPSPRSLTSCRRATTPTTSRRPILTAVRSARPHARAGPAGCLPERIPARRQWLPARGIAAGPPACGDFLSSSCAPAGRPRAHGSSMGKQRAGRHQAARGASGAGRGRTAPRRQTGAASGKRRASVRPPAILQRCVETEVRLRRRYLDRRREAELVGSGEREVDGPHRRGGIRRRKQRVRAAPIDPEGAAQQPPLNLLHLLRWPRTRSQPLHLVGDLRVELGRKARHEEEQFAANRRWTESERWARAARLADSERPGEAAHLKRRAAQRHRWPAGTTKSRPEGRLF